MDVTADQARRLLVGEIPPARGFVRRPETADGLAGRLRVGTALALVPPSFTPGGAPDWHGVTGKTQLAAAIASELWQSGAVDLLVWVPAATRASVVSALAQASAAATGLQSAGTAEAAAARFAQWLNHTGRSWLVVLDDLAADAVPDELWPQGPSGRLLVTSTHPDAVASAARRGTQVVAVGFLSIREALNCLTERLTANPAQRYGAIDLAEELSCEPLALDQAAAVVANSTLVCHDYRDYFARRRKQIGMDAAAAPAAEVTWTLSLGQAESLLPGTAVRNMLILLALLDGQGIPASLVGAPSIAAYLQPSGDPPVGAALAWDALRVLDRVGLITIHRPSSGPVILMNRVLQSAIRLAAPARVHEPAAHAAARALLEIWPETEPQPWTASPLRANVASLHSAATDTLWSAGCHPLLLRAGQSLDGARLTGPAAEYWQELAAICDGKLGPGHPDAHLLAGYLAAALLAAGRAREAITWHQRVLAEQSRQLIPGHHAVIAARVGLAQALTMAGEPAAAVTVLQQAAADSEQTAGAGHPGTLSILEELAAAHAAAGAHAAATQLLARVLADREQAQGPTDPQTLATRDRLAAAYLAQDQVKKAISLYRNVLADREARLGSSHPDTIATRAGLAAAYYAAGRMPSAMQAWEQCCTESAQVLGASHPDTLARQVSRAGVYYAAGRIGDATVILQESLSLCEWALPPSDPLTLAVRQDLANIGENRPKRR